LRWANLIGRKIIDPTFLDFTYEGEIFKSLFLQISACITCIFAWIVAFGLTVPVTAMVEYSYSPESTVCLTSVKTFWPKFYFIFIITVFFFIPLVILVLLYRHIVRHLVPPDDEQVRNHA